MLWNPAGGAYREEPYDLEDHLEEAVKEVEAEMFGAARVYLEVKKLIGSPGKTRNVPDGYLLDLSSPKRPQLWIVESELASHGLTHIASQILKFSISIEADPYKVKTILKEALDKDPQALGRCEAYAAANGYRNVDYLLERAVLESAYSALVIIDELSEDLETALVKRFRFPVEVLTLVRYRSEGGERTYRFDPFMGDLPAIPLVAGGAGAPRTARTAVDPVEIDTVVVPARDDGFQDVILAQDRWHAGRMHASLVPNLKHLAVYRVAPVSAITHVAPVRDIVPWQGGPKYEVVFAAPAVELDTPVRLVPGGTVKAPRGLRYTSRERLAAAKNLDEVF